MTLGPRLRVVLPLLVFSATTFVAPVSSAQSASDVHILSSVTPASESHHRDKPLLKKVEIVLVPVTVTDANNHAVTGLQLGDFHLYEDGQPQTITTLSSEDGPLSLGVIFDTSKSMKDKIDRTREAVGRFFDDSDPKDEFFLVTFSDRPLLLADFATPGEIQGRLMEAVPRGHTSLLDAIYLGLEHVHEGHYPRKALLIISDGGDNSSRYTASEIKEIVRESDVEIYAIGIFDSIFKTPEEEGGERLLRAITEATGGRTFVLHNARELPAIVDEISLELRSQYVLGYRSSNHARDGRWRKIKVKLTAPGDRHVHARAGYAAPSY